MATSREVSGTYDDKLERIGHLCIEALLKASTLRGYPLDAQLKRQLAKIMKTVRGTAKRIQNLADAASKNGILEKATAERVLDRVLKSLEEANRELDELLAKARG